MNFQYSKEQRMIADSAREIAKSFGPEYWYAMEESREFPWEFLKVCGKTGLFSFGIPEKHGGSELGMTEGVIGIKHAR